MARFLRVSGQSVSRWYESWRRGGVQALKKAPRTGRPPQLTAAQLGRLERELLKGARANGYSTELWMLQRVGEVIARVTEVSYHPGHVWKVLRKLGWTRQRPAHRAAERDEEAIETWVQERWPELKKKVLLVWDGLSGHWSKLMRAHLDAQRSWLTVERLPAYAPDLNPVEGFWANLKGRKLANRCDLETADTVAAAKAGVARVRSTQQLLFAFLAHAGLSL